LKRENGNVAAPYEPKDIDETREAVGSCPNVGIFCLPEMEMGHPPSDTLRRRDLVDLFDTTPDLTGNDIDIDRYVRGADESDVRVFWRAWDLSQSPRPPADTPA